MSLKRAKNSFLKSGSITTRLTVLYSLATFILMTVITLFLYGVTVHILHHANYNFLSNEIDILSKLLKNKNVSYVVLEQRVIEVPYTETGSIYHYYIRILNDKNETVIETPRMKNVFKDVEFFQHATHSSIKEADWWNSSNRNYLLMQSQALYGKTGKMWKIQIALDISYQQAVINKYSFVFIICLFIGTIFAIFLGYIIARKGMQSLYDLTEVTKKITANSLSQQIDPKSWPKELKALGKAFNQMLNRIEVSFSHLTQFSADLAHELRTPVNNLMGQTEIILSQNHTLEEYQQVLGSNLEELHRISQIIENLLFLSRAENIQLEIKKSRLNVAKEVKLVCEFYQVMADEKNINIICEGDAVLSANSVMFRRMISNILSNALKYTPHGGKVSFKIEPLEKVVRITLADTGIGIPSEHLPKIFNRFYRIDSARSQDSGGTGLGLAIVKSIVELHHGQISIKSKPDKGTTITIYLPK